MTWFNLFIFIKTMKRRTTEIWNSERRMYIFAYAFSELFKIHSKNDFEI